MMRNPGLQTQHIFIADDDEDDLLLFQEVIKELPYLIHVTTARNGNDALKTLDLLEQLPDLIFLDINMPMKNGIECLNDIKQQKKLVSIPVIMFSTSAYPSAINQVYEAGAHLYVRKPNDYLNFTKTVQHILTVDWKADLSQPPREEFVLSFL